MRRPLWTGLLAGALLTGCLGGDPGGPPTGVRMAIRGPAGAVTITSLELIVLDATATCTQPDASGGSEVMRTTLVLGESRQLSVSAGLRTFSVIAYDGSTAVARGCDTVDLIAGRTHQVDIPAEAAESLERNRDRTSLALHQ